MFAWLSWDEFNQRGLVTSNESFALFQLNDSKIGFMVAYAKHILPFILCIIFLARVLQKKFHMGKNLLIILVYNDCNLQGSLLVTH